MIQKDERLPDIIQRYPGTRRVFDRYGLHGCGGEYGPQESIEFFARVHQVPLEHLLEELEQEKDSKVDGPVYVEQLEDVLYRRFFRAAIAAVLTAGATLGAVMLFLYGVRASFTSLDLFPAIQAHANAQIFGWVGLFVMGFAYQGIPRFKYVRLWHPGVANATLALMGAGLVLRMIALLPGAFWFGVSGGILEAAAIALFVVVVTRTLASSETKDVWDRYVLAALICFLLAGLLEPALYTWIFSAPTTEVLVHRVADFMGPYRDLQIMGFAGIMILGVSQRILPTAFGFRSVSAPVARRAFPMLAVGLFVDIAAWLMFRLTGRAHYAIVSWAGMALYAAGAAWLIHELRAMYGGEPGRSTKFIRAAYIWLAVACLMMFSEPFYTRMLGLHFSHAFHGAIRHAFTVGFISLMIMGVSSKVVPILKGIDLAGLPSLWIPFALINFGNGLRVSSQVATDLAPAAAFPVMGISGLFEVLALALWGAHLWRLMGRPNPVLVEARRTVPIDAEMTPATIVDLFPETLVVFERFGFKELRNPLLRNTLGRRITVRAACSMKNVDLDAFLTALNAARRTKPAIATEGVS